MDDAHDLGLILDSHFPLIVVESHEERRVLALIERLAERRGLRSFAWSITEGFRRGPGDPVIPDTREFTAALRFVAGTLQRGLYVLLDAHAHLDDPLVLRLLREIALGWQTTPRTLVFVSPRIALPAELGRLAARFELRMPTPEDIWRMLTEEARAFEAERGSPLVVEREVAAAFARQLGGLPAEDARRIVRTCMRADGRLDRADLPRLARFRHETLAADATLELELDTGSLEDVGGLRALVRWLGVRRPAFLGEGRAAQLEPPRGILLLGVQGGGKSLAARAVAGSWGVPLLRLDFATLYDKYFGETERKLRSALAAAEALAPCVLWIDEIEKGLAADAGRGMDGGVSRRVLGTLLTWLAERTARVFIAATANDVAELPPELMRKGRFDEIFFVDLPDADTRALIFDIHLRRRDLGALRAEAARFAAATEGWSGAEIEQALVAALYEAHARGEEPEGADVLAEIARTQPLSVVMAERVAALRAWAAGRTVPAD